MSDRKSSSWFYPNSTGDPGRDRNARTLQFSCFLLAFAIGAVLIVSAIEREWQETPLLVFAIAGFIAAAVINRAGRSDWAGRTAFLVVLLGAILLVFQAHDGFRSHSMLVFPGLLLISVMMLDRASYVMTAGIVVVAVAALGIAVKHGLTRATPPVRTTYDSIFYVDLNLLVIAIIGSRIARDTQSNATDLRTIINQLSAANLALTESAEALRQSEVKYRRLHESITDAVVAVDMAGHTLETNLTFQSMLGYTGEELCRMTSQELTPERWHAVEAQIVAEQVMARGHSEVYEKEYRRRDGTVFPIEVRTYLIRNEGNQPIGMWAIVRDISGRKRDEQVISKGEQRLRIAKDAAKLGIYQYDVATGTILWDARVRQLWGVGPDVPITLDTFFSGLHPADRARTQVLLERALDPAGNGEYYAEYRVISHEDGSERWVAATGQVFFENGRAVHMIGTGQDISERKRAEAAVRESEERLRAMFSQAAVGISLTSPDGVWLAVNDRFCKMLAYAESELRGKPFLEFTHPDDLEKSRDAARRLLAGEIPSWQVEKRYVGKDGNVVWARVSVSLVRDPDGEPKHFIAVVEDISERIQSESALRESERRLSLALRAAQLGVWDCNLRKDEVVLSPKYREVYHRDPLTRAEWLSLVHPDDRERVLAAARECLSSTRQWDAEFRVLLPDGGIRWVHSSATVLVDEAEQPVRMVGVSQDVTEQVKARELLRESEERLRNAERIAHVGNWSWDVKTNEVSWSEEVFRIFGMPEDHKPSFERFVESIPAQDRDRVDQWMSDCLSAKRGGSIEHQIVHSNGAIRTVICTSEVLLDKRGMPVRLFGTCQDVTDARRAQEESFARQRLESVGTLAGGIAHDFNNLLGGVLGQAELALTELETGSAPEEELKAIREVALRGSEIVRQLMIYAGKESETIGPVDLSRTVAEMVELLKVSASKQAVLVTDLGQDLPAVQANAAQIRRIVMNLVTNASQAIGNRDGVIRVRTGRLAAVQAAALAHGSAERGYLELEVSDNGCGMPLEMQSKVFDPFFTTGSAGHGLGLAVVQGIVRNLGGTIQLASEPGRGTTFRILMPSAPAAAEEAAGQLSSAGEPARELLAATVLLVEDEDVLRQSVAKMLRRRGAEVLEAANGSAAIELLRTKGSQIDVIVLDLTIPGPSSQEVLAEAAQGRPDLKVILTSAYSEEMAAASMGSPIVRRFVRKPFPLQDLVQTLRNVLSS